MTLSRLKAVKKIHDFNMYCISIIKKELTRQSEQWATHREETSILARTTIGQGWSKQTETFFSYVTLATV